MSRKAFFSNNVVSLGDVFSSSGVVRYFSKMYDTLYVAAMPNYYETVRCLYSDISSVIVLPYEDYLLLKASSTGADDLFPGFSPNYKIDDNGRRNMIGEEICDFFSLPKNLHYTNFNLPTHIPGEDDFFNLVTQGHKEYIVVNRFLGADNVRLNFLIDYLNPNGYHVVEMNPFTTHNILHYVKVFQNAKQIHTVPTSVYCLIDRMKHKLKGELFLHDLRKAFFEKVSGWQIISYSEEHRI